MNRISFLALIACASVASAQGDTTTRRDTARLAPTVVTVTRIPLDVSRAPYAIAVTERSEIQRGKPGFALDEALAGIAGVQVDNRFNYALGERISIRGFGARPQFGVRGVRVLLDGIPMTLADGQTTLNNVDVSTLARAEVIRGPTSTLYGNASGGVIQLQTDEVATTRQVGGTLRTDVGDHGLRRHQLRLGGRRESLSYSIIGSRMFFEGFRQWNDATNDHIGFLVSDNRDRRSISVTGNWAEYSARNPGGLTTALLAANRDTVSTTNYNNRTGERGRQGQFGATWRERLSFATVDLSVHGLSRQVDNPIPFTIVKVDRDAGGARLALSRDRMVGGRALSLAGGTEIQIQRDDRFNFVNTGGNRGATTLNQNEHVTNNALFLQGTIDLVPQVLAVAGVRYDRVQFSVRDRFITPTNPDDSGERTMSATTPSAGLTWSPLSSTNLYANFAASFETPTTSELANQPSGAGGMNQTLNPQRTRSVEVGVKHSLSMYSTNGSLRMAVYNARVEDALIPFELAPGGRQYFQNAGSLKNRGVEAEASLAFPLHLSLRASFSHVDSRFDEFQVTSGAPPTTNVFDGKRVPGVAANNAQGILSFEPGWFFMNWETRSQSSIHVDNANTQKSPGYTIHSVRVGPRELTAGGVSVQPTLGVLNLFDAKYNTSVVVNANGGRFYEPGPPRSLYGGLAARF